MKSNKKKSTIVKIRDDLNLDEEMKEALKEIAKKEESAKENSEKK